MLKFTLLALLAIQLFRFVFHMEFDRIGKAGIAAVEFALTCIIVHIVL